MLSTRNVIVAVVAIAAISIVAACVSLAQPPEGSGLGIDSYGTRAHGFRGLFEILEELKVPVDRSVAPPDRVLDREVTLALLEPNAMFTATEPAYLRAIGRWVREGGHLVVAPSSKQLECKICLPEGCRRIDVMTELGLPGISIEHVGTSSRSERDEGEEHTFIDSRTRQASADYARTMFGATWEVPTFQVHALTEGDFKTSFPAGLDLTLPAVDLQVLKEGGPAAKGRVQAVVESGGESPRTLAAIYASGRGTVAVIADSRLLQNRFISQTDNPVLAFRLIMDAGRPAVFDDFYHGLTVRGNPLWLFSRFPYGLLAVAILAATLIVAWRAARFLGPPQPARANSRRTLTEYIEAMARLLNRTRSPLRFTLGEIRAGLLWRARHDLGLPAGTEDAQAVVRILSRRDADAADRLREALNALDDALKQPVVRASALERTLEKVSLCDARSPVSICPQ